MDSNDSQSASINPHRESWIALHDSYNSGSGRGVDFRFRYIVNRLFDSDVSQRFTVGEAFLFTYHGEEREPERKSLEELEVDFLIASRPTASGGRGLYFTNGPYGERLDRMPHVVVYASLDGATLYARFCRGREIVFTHICQARKEIPCLLSLLDLLSADATGSSV